MKTKLSLIQRAFLIFGVVLLFSGFCLAQDFPTKPVNVVVSFSPGGSLDTSARILCAKAEKFLGQPIVVSNVGGGNGAVALAQVATKAADGYTVVCCTNTGLIRVPQLRNVPYGPESFIPIAQFAAAEWGVVVKADSPYKTFKDLVEFAKANPGKVTYATSGAGSTTHVFMEYIADKEGLKWTHVPQQGGAQGLTSVLGGHVTAMADGTEWLPHVKEGSLRLLVTHGDKRMRKFPDVPTLKDLGYDYVSEATFVLATPKGTPPEVVKKLDDSFRKAMDDPQFIQTIEGYEFTVFYRNSDDLQKYLDDGYKKFGEMMKRLGIQKEQ